MVCPCVINEAIAVALMGHCVIRVLEREPYSGNVLSSEEEEKQAHCGPSDMWGFAALANPVNPLT